MSVVKVLRHGQITLPKTLREVLDIKEGDILEIELEHSHLVLKTKVLVDRENLTAETVDPPTLPIYQHSRPLAEPKTPAQSRRGEGAA